jgi:hypothetical protein
MNSSDNFNHEPQNKLGNTELQESWTPEHERILLMLHKYANIQYKKYHETHIRYRKKLAYYRIPIIIITGIMGLLSISNSAYIPIKYRIYVSLLVGISNVVVTIISLIETFKKIDATKAQALESYITYKQISDELSLILRLPRCERNDTGIATIKKYFKIFEKCQLLSPVLQINSKDLFELNTLNDIKNDDFNIKPDKKQWEKAYGGMKKIFTPSNNNNHPPNKNNYCDESTQSSIQLPSNQVPIPFLQNTAHEIPKHLDVEKANFNEFDEDSDFISIDSNHYDINNINDLRNMAQHSLERDHMSNILQPMINKNSITNTIKRKSAFDRNEPANIINNTKNKKNIVKNITNNILEKEEKYNKNIENTLEELKELKVNTLEELKVNTLEELKIDIPTELKIDIPTELKIDTSEELKENEEDK